MMKLKRWIVTAVDLSDASNGHPACLGSFDSKDDAETYVRNDMEERCDQFADLGLVTDFSRMEIVNWSDSKPVFIWSIDEVEIEVNPKLEKEVLDLCNEAYEKGYNEGVATTEEEACIS